ncbi:hypothetical protein PIB30_052513 [Stylosanthes scabra]|uniref:Uncharacterized protein n=1 Tax=Stylosanthes scabra TaxID=79078 RepID=A0ABU6XGR0_9FABA|nr:hypothetical protein [Stylosanthes scabra]
MAELLPRKANMEAGKGGEFTHDETTIISGALDLTEKEGQVWIAGRIAINVGGSQVLQGKQSGKFYHEAIVVSLYIVETPDIIGLLLEKYIADLEALTQEVLEHGGDDGDGSTKLIDPNEVLRRNIENLTQRTAYTICELTQNLDERGRSLEEAKERILVLLASFEASQASQSAQDLETIAVTHDQVQRDQEQVQKMIEDIAIYYQHVRSGGSGPSSTPVPKTL